MLNIRMGIAACLLLLVISTSSVCSQTKTTFAYPPANRGGVIDDYNGVKVADPYRWLEDLDSRETRAWVAAQAELTGKYLEKIPSRTALRERLTSLMDYEKYGAPFRRQNRYFYTHNKGLDPQSILYTTVGLDGAPSVLL